MTTPQEEWPDIPTGADNHTPHIVYTLGPDIPIGDIPTKGVYANARVWVLDQILTKPRCRRNPNNSSPMASRWTGPVNGSASM